MFWMYLLVILLSTSLPQGESVAGTPLCFETPPADPANGDLSFRFSPDAGTDFSGASSGCGGGLDGLLGRGGPWARAAGTAVEASRLMLGVDLSPNKLLQYARRLGLAPQAPDRPDIGPFDAQRDEAYHIRSHFLFRASRKSLFLGFGIQW